MMVLLAPLRAKTSLPPALRLLGVSAAFLGALISLASSSVLPIGAVLGAIVLVYSAVHPRFAAVLVMLLWAGPFATQAAGRRVAGLTIDAADVVVVAAVIGYVYRCWRDRRPLVGSGGGWTFVLPLAVFLGVLVFGVVRGYTLGNARGTAADALLAASALSAYVLLRIAYQGRLRTFVSDVVLVCAIGCTVLVAAALMGEATRLGVVVDAYDTRGVQDSTLRIDAPVQRLSILGILLLATGAAPYKTTALWPRLIWAIPLVAGLAVSQTRSTWLPVIVAVVVVPALALRARAIFGALLRRGVISGAVLILTLGLGSAGVLGSYGESVAARFLSAGDRDVLQDDSYQQRLVENEKAYMRIAEEPVWGIGFPRDYGAYIPYWPENLGIQVFVARDFIHNSYLGIAMFFGMPGLLSLATLVACVLVLARRTSTASPGVRAVPLACLGALGVLALTSTFQTQLRYEPFYLTMAVILAMADLWLSRPPVASTAHRRQRTAETSVSARHGWLHRRDQGAIAGP